jgi:mycofactocin precursor
MSQSTADDQYSESEQELTDTDTDPELDDDEDPEIEEDLLQEELRIDGICGVY